MPNRWDSIRTRHLGGITHGSYDRNPATSSMIVRFPKYVEVDADEAQARGWVTVEQIAHAARVTPGTVRNWTASREGRGGDWGPELTGTRFPFPIAHLTRQREDGHSLPPADLYAKGEVSEWLRITRPRTGVHGTRTVPIGRPGAVAAPRRRPTPIMYNPVPPPPEPAPPPVQYTSGPISYRPRSTAPRNTGATT